MRILQIRYCCYYWCWTRNWCWSQGSWYSLLDRRQYCTNRSNTIAKKWKRQLRYHQLPQQKLTGGNLSRTLSFFLSYTKSIGFNKKNEQIYAAQHYNIKWAIWILTGAIQIDGRTVSPTSFVFLKAISDAQSNVRNWQSHQQHNKEYSVFTKLCCHGY